MSDRFDAQNEQRNIVSALEQAQRDIATSKTKVARDGTLSQITADLGVVRAGAFYALSQGDYPTDSDACGVFMDAGGIDDGTGSIYNIGGVNNGELQFGLDAATGKAMTGGGAVVLDTDGVWLYGDASARVALQMVQMVSAVKHSIGGVLDWYDSVSGFAWVRISSYLAASNPWTKATSSLEAVNLNVSGRATTISADTNDDIYAYARVITLNAHSGAPAVAMTGAVSAGGSVDAGVHKYGCTFVDGEGETTLDTNYLLEVTTTLANKTVSLSNIPLGMGGTRIQKRRLYRTAAGSADPKYLGEIADNTTTTYTDTAADASLGADPPAANTTGLVQINGKVHITGDLIVDGSGGGGISWGTDLTAGADQNRNTGSSYSSLVTSLTVRRTIKITAVLWDVRIAGAYELHYLYSNAIANTWETLWSGAVAAPGEITMALAAPIVLTPGVYYLGLKKTDGAAGWSDLNAASYKADDFVISGAWYDGSAFASYTGPVKLTYNVATYG